MARRPRTGFAALLALSASAGSSPAKLPLRAEPPGVLTVSSSTTWRDGLPFAFDIALRQPDGGKAVLFPHTSEEEFDPEWSPDGTQIAFAMVAKPTERCTNIWVMDAKGGNRKRLTSFPSGTISASPTWSPDGKRIAFCAGVPGQGGGIRVMDSNGKHSKVIGPGMSPAWSPTANRLLYLYSPRGITILNLSTGRRSRVAQREVVSAAAWSPDGRSIVYIAPLEETASRGPSRYPLGAWRMRILDMQTGKLTPVMQGIGQAPAIQWHSPRWIVYTRFVEEALGIPADSTVFAFNVSGKKTHALTSPSTIWFTGGGASGLWLSMVLLEFLEHEGAMGSSSGRIKRSGSAAQARRRLFDGGGRSELSPEKAQCLAWGLPAAESTRGSGQALRARRGSRAGA